MQKTEEFCVDESGWIHCPFCKCRTRTKIRADTSLKNFPIFCPKCKQECLINDEEKRNVVTALIKEIEIYRNDESEFSGVQGWRGSYGAFVGQREYR